MNTIPTWAKVAGVATIAGATAWLLLRDTTQRSIRVAGGCPASFDDAEPFHLIAVTRDPEGGGITLSLEAAYPETTFSACVYQVDEGPPDIVDIILWAHPTPRFRGRLWTPQDAWLSFELVLELDGWPQDTTFGLLDDEGRLLADILPGEPPALALTIR